MDSIEDASGRSRAKQVRSIMVGLFRLQASQASRAQERMECDFKE